MKKTALLILLISSLCSGCAAAKPRFPGPKHLVAEITITCSNSSFQQRHYTDQQSMGKILQYLRNVEFSSDEIHQLAPGMGSEYCIILTHSTGQVTVYRQIANSYLSKGSSPWHQLDPEQGKQLETLFRNLPSDGPSLPVWYLYDSPQIPFHLVSQHTYLPRASGNIPHK